MIFFRHHIYIKGGFLFVGSHNYENIQLSLGGFHKLVMTLKKIHNDSFDEIEKVSTIFYIIFIIQQFHSFKTIFKLLKFIF